MLWLHTVYVQRMKYELVLQGQELRTIGVAETVGQKERRKVECNGTTYITKYITVSTHKLSNEEREWLE